MNDSQSAESSLSQASTGTVKLKESAAATAGKEQFVETDADAFLEIIRTLPGIEYIFADTGTDHSPLIEALAKSEAYNKHTPRIVTAPHEIAAVNLAVGFYLASGRPQFVLVHTVPGTLNAHGMLANANSSQIPLILVAGRTPVTESGVFGGKNIHIHWTQETRDQGALIRDSVKWDFEYRTQEQLADMVFRAYQVAMSEPRGPVYLIFPREIWAEQHSNFKVPSQRKHMPSTPPQPETDALKKIVRALIDADSPLVIPDLLTKSADCVPALVKLCRLLALPVSPTLAAMSYPTNDSLFIGHYGMPGPQQMSSAYFKSADSLFFIDTPVPWIPNLSKPRDDARIFMMGHDPTFSSIPTWGFPVEVAALGDPSLGLQGMIPIAEEILEGEPETRRRLKERLDKISEDHDKFKRKLTEDVERVKNDKPIDFVWLSHCIGKVKDEGTIIVNEYDLRPDYVEFTRPNTMFGHINLGCLGWGLGAAIGVKFASPQSTVIATLGDGAYLASVPTACHFTANAYKVPILAIVFNNQCWGASRQSVRNMYPDGFASRAHNFPGVNLSPSPDYAGVAKACGAYAETVEEPGEVEPALVRAMSVVRKEKRQALLNVICKYPTT